MNYSFIRPLHYPWNESRNSKKNKTQSQNKLSPHTLMIAGESRSSAHACLSKRLQISSTNLQLPMRISTRKGFSEPFHINVTPFDLKGYFSRRKSMKCHKKSSNYRVTVVIRVIFNQKPTKSILALFNEVPSSNCRLFRLEQSHQPTTSWDAT